MNALTLHRVTFTGADDHTEPAALADVATRHPWVEFGVLVSEYQQGTGRYPSRAWRERFYCSGVPSHQRALHLCGRAVDQFIAGTDALCREIDQVQRVQLNFTVDRFPPATLVALPRIFQEWHQFAPDIEFILQLNQTNAILPALIASPHAKNLSFLVDSSGGRGIAPRTWPAPVPGYPTAYAGGIGPDRLRETLKGLSAVTPRTAIDMESSLRTEDRFDLDKVQAVIGQLLANCTPVEEGTGHVVLALRGSTSDS